MRNVPNRLAAETSPYLRQHADNPVDWFPWGDEALAEAARLDRPLLISVGYSSCHWCHVMAHESFEDPHSAAVMNELFVNVKVDREERPDVDAVYMDAVTALSGRGGWPMTVFAFPDGRPFFAGTYFPKESRSGHISFVELCLRIDELWRTQRQDLDDEAASVTESLGRMATLTPAADLPGADAVTAAIAALVSQFDPQWGGFGSAPKFPQAMSLELLARAVVRDGDDTVLEVLTTTLDAMASGGMYDHIGGGFARYSVDREWLVPHFEKMLYDQAFLARAYLHGWQLTGQARYRQVLDETVDYVSTVLTRPEGGIASAEDADSEGEEGRFYVWSADAFTRTLAEGGLSNDEVATAAAWWGVTDDGNFEGSNILWRPIRGDLLRPEVIGRARAILGAARDRRVRPGLDDKVLTEWNALWIATLAEAAAATDSPEWARQALRCGEFLVEHLRRADGRWMRSWQRDPNGVGQARHLAYAADYAALVDAFVRLAELTGDPVWVDHARSAADGLIALFWDEANGGVFTTGGDAPSLVTRPKDFTDNASPAANSLAALALARLGAMTGVGAYTERSEDICRLVGPLAERHPTAFTHLLGAVELHTEGITEVVVSGDRADLLEVVRARFRPHAVTLWGEPWDSPLWEERRADSPGRAYVCRQRVCDLPADTPEGLSAQLDGN